MEKITLGRTGLTVSVAGLGCGGHSRLGQSYGNTVEQSVTVVRAAMDLGVNFIDTAAIYGTEHIVGQAIAGRRDQVVISTKLPIVPKGASVLGQEYVRGAEFAQSLETSLSRLGTDYIDILHLHGVMPDQYDYCLAELVPALLRLRKQGKVRFLGLTERFIYDPQHAMLAHALQDDLWDVVMTGFNLINPSARQRVFALTREKNIGALVMFAVRRVLSDADALKEIVTELMDSGLIAPGKIDPSNPLGFLTAEGDAASIVEAAYRFCRHEPGAHVVLTGTGRVEHLQANLVSLLQPPLGVANLARLGDIFGKIDSVSGD